MRLLFVHERLGAFAGAEANIQSTADELQRRGHTLGLLHGPPTGRGQARWLQLFPQRYPLADRDNALRTERAVASFQPDAVYIHKMADLDLLRVLADSPSPIVRMVHDHDLYCMRSYKYFYFSRRICTRAASPFCVLPCGAFVRRNRDGGFPLRWVSYASKLEELRVNKRFARFVVASRFMAEELARNGFCREKIEVHPPVPPAGDPSWRSSFADRNIIIYAGQIIRGKGVDILLRSLAQTRTPFECFIFGDGNHRNFCEELSRKLNLADRVRFKGYVSPEEINAYYRECSVVLMSSLWPEPFGAAGLEAMRFGLPIVAFDAGGIKEWLVDGQNGFLVPWMDATAMAQKIELLLADKALARRLGEQGRASLARHHTFSNYVDGLEELFARVTDQPPVVTAA